MTFLPSTLFAFAQSNRPPKARSPEFHLHPKYRTQTPLDATLRKVKPGSDQFVNEAYAAQIEDVLQLWSADLRNSPISWQALERTLATDFVAYSPAGAQSKTLRSGAIEIQKRTFDAGASVDRKRFMTEWKSAFTGWSEILTADFQVTAIDVNDAGSITTQVLYELVATGQSFHREQRVGTWEIVWKPLNDGWQAHRWLAHEQTCSRAIAPVFAEISSTALGKNHSYKDQLLHGSDYWRTVLDGASGIDIYGHNGVCVGDLAGDGFDDLYVCQPAGLPNRLYRNLGDGTFEDITEGSGLGLLENTSCALFADINNDGMQDLIVVRTTGPALFLNQGGGRFREQAEAFKFANAPQGTFTGAAIADYDRDGWLDVYFCLYAFYQGTDQYRYPSPYYDAQNGPPNFMMRNNRDGTFRDVTQESGLSQNNNRYSFCCSWADYNNDGWPDLYVVNDFGRKNLYRNNGNGTFTDVADEVNAADIGAGMSVSWLDYDNNGAQDVYVANMWTAAGQRISDQRAFQKDVSSGVRQMYRKHAMGNSLLRNDSGTFHDSTSSAGSGNGRWAWSSDAWDFDHDGSPDLYVTNGMISGTDQQDLNSFFWRQVVANSPEGAKPSIAYERGWTAINELIRADGTWSGRERNVFFVNHGDGTFSDISGAVGLDFREDGRSFALADFDHDGRLEVFLKNRNGPQLRVLKNLMADLPGSVAFHLEGSKSNRDAIGAVVTIETEAGRQTRTLQCGSGFLSQHSKQLFFGLGAARNISLATIRWPSGAVEEFRNLPTNCRIAVKEASGVTHTERFLQKGPYQVDHSPPSTEELPSTTATWLLAPILAPELELPDSAGKKIKLSSFRGKPVLLTFFTPESEECRRQRNLLSDNKSRLKAAGLQVVLVNVANTDQPPPSHDFDATVLQGSSDAASVYNLVFRYLFERHRDLTLPTSFLIDAGGMIVRVYQGLAQNLQDDCRQIPTTDAERIRIALPFPGNQHFEFGRNYLSFGSAFFQRGYYDEAGAAFEDAMRKNASSAEALYGVGSVYLQQGKNMQAREAFERVLKMTPGYFDTLPNTWNNLGILATREQRMSEAAECFQHALQLKPDHLIALDNLGNAYRELQQWDKAQQVLERAVEINPEDPEANYNLGMVYAQTNNNRRAEEFLKNALQYRSDYPEALNNLGILYVRTQRVDQGVALFQQCMKVDPTFDKCYLSLAQVYAIEDKRDQARAILNELLAQHPGHRQGAAMLDQLKQ